MSKPYALAALGGTFDRLHDGHKHFLKTAFQYAEALVIGVTVPSMNSAKAYAERIEEFDKRIEHLHTFLKTFEKPYRLIPLTDIYGETLTNQHVDALAITTLTHKGAKMVNQKRGELGLQPLPLIEASMLTTTHGDILSSSLIRTGLIDRSGFAYADLFSQDLRLSEQQKELLRMPQGKLLKSEQKIDERRLRQATKVATVGDIVTRSFLHAGIRVDYALVDYRSKKQSHVWRPQDYWTQVTRNITNSAGQIVSQAAASLFKQVALDSCLFIIDGEEDLLALPMVLCMPLGSLLYYGQPNRGIVELEISESLKNKFLKFVRKDLPV